MWKIRYGDEVVESDDFTISELGEVEKVTGVPWSVANPYRDVKVARAFIAVALAHLGRSEDEVVAEIESLTLGKIKNVFTFVPEEVVDESDEEGEESGPPASTSPASSTGARSGAGSRRKSAASG